MDYKNETFGHKEESKTWKAARELQGTITILDPSIFD
jgi:hypothetical protein